MEAEAAAAPAPEETTAQRKERKRSTILVSIEGWPFQEPGRLMIWGWRPSPQKAAREVKRLKQRFAPNIHFTIEPLTATQARTIRLKPFNLRDYQRRMGARIIADEAKPAS